MKLLLSLKMVWRKEEHTMSCLRRAAPMPNIIICSLKVLILMNRHVRPFIPDNRLKARLCAVPFYYTFCNDDILPSDAQQAIYTICVTAVLNNAHAPASYLADSCDKFVFLCPYSQCIPHFPSSSHAASNKSVQS